MKIGVAKVYYNEYKSGHRKRWISKAMEVGLILLLSFTLFGYIVDAKFGYMFVKKQCIEITEYNRVNHHPIAKAKNNLERQKEQYLIRY